MCLRDGWLILLIKFLPVLIGKENALINSHKTNTQPFFGNGKHKDNKYWMALLRQVLVASFLKKDIETYGVIKLTEAGRDFIKSPASFLMTEDHIFEGEQEDGSIITAEKGTGAVADTVLMNMLKDLRKKNAKKIGVPPFVIFQDPSLEDMALKYLSNGLINRHLLKTEVSDTPFTKDHIEKVLNQAFENLPWPEEIIRKVVILGEELNTLYNQSQEIYFLTKQKLFSSTSSILFTRPFSLKEILALDFTLNCG